MKLRRMSRNALCWIATSDGPVHKEQVKRMTGWSEAGMQARVTELRRYLAGRLEIIRKGECYSVRAVGREP